MLFKYEGHANSSGIYVIFNNTNWRLYVGSCRTFKTRWAAHSYALRRGKHGNRFLQADFNKCGEEAFEFHVLEHLPNSVRDDRLVVEEKWLAVHYDAGKQCYNLINKAISREGIPSKNPEETRKRHREAAIRAGCKPPNHAGVKRSEETKQKLSAALKGNTCSLGYKRTDAEKEAMRGNKRGLGYRHTDEAKKKISEASKRMAGTKRGPMSEEHKQSIRLALIGKPQGKRGPMSEEHKQKISEANSGRVFTAEHKKNISLAKLGLLS